MSEVAVPDAVRMGSGATVADLTAEWRALDPCPACGARPHDAPEGVTLDGTPRHVFPHCWKCGFRPGVNQAVDLDHMRAQFEAFQKFTQEQTQMALDAAPQQSQTGDQFPWRP